MAALIDPERLLAYRNALSNWEFKGFVEPEMSDQAYRCIHRELGRFEIKELYRLMHEYVEAGGEIDEVLETRPEWSDRYEYHYDLRLAVHSKPVYIETRLIYHPPFVPDEPTILVVNAHAP